MSTGGGFSLQSRRDEMFIEAATPEVFRSRGARYSFAYIPLAGS
jgi:hypothetical protein